MVNGIILRKFDDQIDLIKTILSNYLNSRPQSNHVIQSVKDVPKKKPIQTFNKGDAPKIKHIQSIKNPHSKGITSLCELKDKRLVSSDDEIIVVYNHSYKPQIKIERAHDDIIFSLCALKNGSLASSSFDKTIKLWKIYDSHYEFIYTLTGHTGSVWKVIELEDGKLCSCSSDATIKIWKYYQCIKTLTGNINVKSIIEMNNFIISVSDDGELRIWDESAYECIQAIQNVYCYSPNGLLKLNNNTLIVGCRTIVYFVNIGTSEIKMVQDQSLGDIWCLNVLKNGLVLFGNHNGEICFYDLSSNKIILKRKYHNGIISCLIKAEDDHLISASEDKTINLYEDSSLL